MPGQRSLCPALAGITFDPTNRGIGGFNLVPVAVGRDICQVMPVSGSYTGPTDMLDYMSVEVELR